MDIAVTKLGLSWIGARMPNYHVETVQVRPPHIVVFHISLEFYW